MADIGGVTLSAGSSPPVNYTITYTKSRPSNSQMTYNFTISCSLGSSGSYINAGYALLCTITVNGSSNDVRIKANDNDNWSGTTPRVRSVSVTCASTTGNATQPVRFKVISDGRMTLSSGVIDNSGDTVLSSALLYTACGAPTSCSVDQTVVESNVTLSWAGASSGNNNSIVSYEIQYSDSSNNSSWGAWTALTTVTTTDTTGSVSVSPPSTRGNYRRFQVRTRGSAGSSYYSVWKESASSVRKNKWPLAPTSVTASPSVYSNEGITLSWSGASSGTSAIKGYQIASRTSSDGSSWGSWRVLAIIDLSASSGSYNPAVSSVSGTYTQFGVWTIDALDVYSSETISNSIYCNTTACLPPQTVSVSQTLAEGNVTLAWSGAGSGAGNAINSFEIQSSDSTDGFTWGAWNPLTTIQSTATSGSTSVAPSSIRGNYRRFQIRACGAAGLAYYSPWSVSSNPVRKNILPVPPAVFTASPTVYHSGNVSLLWSGTVLGTSAIKTYNIQKSTSSDGQVTWTAWESAATVTSSDTAGSAEVIPSNVAGIFTRYRLSVTDALNGVTGYVYSNVVRKNTPPLIPTVLAPKSGSYTYNQTPLCLIQTQSEPDGNPQAIYAHSSAGYWQNSVDNPEAFTTSGATARGIKTVYINPSTGFGLCEVSIQCRDDYSSGSTVTRAFTILENPFEEISANVTHVKASHIISLRLAINHVRNYYNLTPYPWVSEIIPGRTQIRDWPFHILELRAAIQGAIDRINSFDETGSEIEVTPIAWNDIGNGRPRADVMLQLQNLILSI